MSTKTDSASFTGTRLLVPMQVEAMAISNLDRCGGDTQWSMGVTDYRTMAAALDPEPGPFNKGSRTLNPDRKEPTQKTCVNAQQPNTLPNTGVMLHWALPGGLTHGVQSPDRTIVYPFVPNRWFVARIYTDPQNTNRRLSRAWIVQSDYVGADGTTLIPSPTRPDSTTFIGKVWPLDQWPGETDAQAPFLTAVGPGDVAFAAFYPNVQSVFGMQDSLEDLPNYQGSLTYLVAGWYSDPAKDVLAQASATDGETWAGVAATLQWSVGDEQDLGAAVAAAQAWLQTRGQSTASPCPLQTLCHGMVHSLPWCGAGGPPEGFHDDRVRVGQYTRASKLSPQIAVGNSAAEALSAYLANTLLIGNTNPDAISQIETILSAFQDNLLSELDGPDGGNELLRGLHAAPFESRAGGTRWRISSAVTTTPKPGDPATPPLTSDQLSLLVQLNTTQEALDASVALQATRQQLLYALWWKQKQGAQDVAALIPQVQADIVARAAAIAGAQAKVDLESASSLSAQLVTSLGDSWKLTRQTIPRWWRSSDPVVLLANVGRSFKHDPLGADPSDTLFCRFSGQTVASLAVKASADAKAPSYTVNASDLAAGPSFIPPPITAVPPEIADLCTEAFFLDITNAAALAALAGPKLGVDAGNEAFIDNIQIQQTLVWNSDVDPSLDRETLTKESGLGGVIPSLISATYWEPPWSPLFLDWKVAWYPSGADPSSNIASWSFDGIDYTTATPVTTDGVHAEYQGRTVLTPNATRALRQQLDDFLRGSPDQVSLQWAINTENAEIPPDWAETVADQLQSVVDAISEWDLLAQSLGGLTDALMQTVPGWNFDPGPPLASALAGAELAVPDPSKGYYPLRAGAFKIVDLSIVDAFGQVVKPLGDHPQGYPWIKAQSMIPPASPGDPGLMYLRPRLTFPSRLLLRQLSANDDAQDTALDPRTTPICGWLLPNCLDQTLLIYDGQGQLLGELLTARGGPEQIVEWVPAPGTALSADAIPNIHLRRVVAGLLIANPDSGAALDELLVAIDDSAWSSATGGGATNGLATLMGRPLALVRAQIQLQGRGDLPCDQSVAGTAQTVSGTLGGDGSALSTVTHGLGDLAFDVQLGSTASSQGNLVGFFADAELEQDRFPRFHTTYLQQGNSGNYLIDDPVVAVSFNQSRNILLVMDRFAQITLSSGILPTTRAALPTELVNDALATMEVAFQISPILIQPNMLELPTPGRVQGTWAWMAQSAPDTWETRTQVGKSDSTPNLTLDPTQITEGWLILSGSLATSTSIK